MSNELMAEPNTPEEKRAGSERHTHHRRPPLSSDLARVEELDRENIRLQLLVAELLIKNQQLRKSD